MSIIDAGGSRRRIQGGSDADENAEEGMDEDGVEWLDGSKKNTRANFEGRSKCNMEVAVGH